MREITYHRRRNRKGIVIGVLAAFFVLAALVIFGLFRVQKVVISGNSIYTASEIEKAILQDGLCKNTLYLLWKYKDDSKVEKELPFLSSLEVKLLNPYKVQIRVYEKPEIGYFLSGTDYIYFDRDGLIVEISKKLRNNVPELTGVAITKPQRYEVLPIKEEDVFDNVVHVTQILNKNALTPRKINFDDEQNMTLYFEKARVKLGNSDDLEEKIAALKSIYEKVSMMEGGLHMESFTADAQTITFKQGEIEEELEVDAGQSGEEAAQDTDGATAAEDGQNIEGQGADGTTSESGETNAEDTQAGPTYSESDGTFSTDDQGNTIYTDAAGNSTPNVDGYQYTDESGNIITDGYGYIDPYTGSYILK